MREYLPARTRFFDRVVVGADQATRKPAPAAPPRGPLSLPALLSQVLVAHTIELDNEAEHRLPHRITNHGTASQDGGTWLTSVAMFENCLRFVTDQPITVGELETLARTPTNLDGMRRWGYLTIDGTAGKTYKSRPGPHAVLRATARGLRARETWLPVSGAIEQRWAERYARTERDRATCRAGPASPRKPWPGRWAC